PGRLNDLDGIDLLVVNAAAGPSGSARTGVERALERFLARGGGIFAVHVGVCSLLDLPRWPEVSGAAWMPGGRCTRPWAGAGSTSARPGTRCPRGCRPS